MTDLMKLLPTDITRLVWEFVGNDVLQTPTAKVMRTLINPYAKEMVELHNWMLKNQRITIEEIEADDDFKNFSFSHFLRFEPYDNCFFTTHIRRITKKFKLINIKEFFYFRLMEDIIRKHEYKKEKKIYIKLLETKKSRKWGNLVKQLLKKKQLFTL